MKTIYRLTIAVWALLSFLPYSYAQRFFYLPDGKGGYFNLKVIDDKTNEVKASLPDIFSSVYWNRESCDDFVVAELGFSVSLVLDTSLAVRAVFPYNSVSGYFVNGICLFGSKDGIGALDVDGKIIIEPEYDHIFDFDNGLVALKNLETLSGNCFELLNTSYDGRKIQSFSIFIPDEKIASDRVGNDEGEYYRSFTSEDLIETEYAGDSLIVERTLAYGLYNMYRCNFKDAKECFYECISAGSSNDWLINASKYNILVCEMMMSGEANPFRVTGPLDSYQVYAALNGLYGKNVQDMFALFYELPMIVHYNHNVGRKVLPYKEYADKVFYDKAGFHPYSDGIDNAVSELQTLKENFLISEFREPVRCNVVDGTFDTMIVSLGDDGSISFHYNTDKYVPDDVFRESYYIDVYGFILSVAEKYGFDRLMMTFPY